jgi:hypothetical protein
MDPEHDIPRWRRLLTALVSLIITLGVFIAFQVLRDFKRDDDFYWGKGGESGVILFLLIVSAPFLLSIAIVIISTALLIPVGFQRKRWPVMLGLAAAMPLCIESLFLTHGYYRIPNLRNFLRTEGPYLLFFVFFALICCGVYLSLLRWLELRHTKALVAGNVS